MNPEPPEPVEILTADQYRLQAHIWSARSATQPPRSVVVIAPATSVLSRYYARFAAFLCSRGHDVVTFDYRGIGGSRHGALRGLEAGWLDWGSDLEAVLSYVRSAFPAHPIDVVGHSVGGFLIGMAPSALHVRRIFTVGAQYAYWRDYTPSERRGMLLRWHLLMPAIVALAGYLPAKRLGWMEDTPKGVVRDWSGMGSRFENSLRHGSGHRLSRDEAERLVERFASVTAPILAVGANDDPFGTPSAVDRLLAYFTGADRHHLRLDAASLGFDAIGHFAFFNERFRDVLWPLASDWLEDQKVPTLPLITAASG
ncbi:alpha/beta fold hydrolase [uncultured Nevskia sp.]|uniref:alpha/beta hydrolase family protein n=1 Tax=uncultured Nevskia sp. TaxID=228950 RepID=UPI0025CD404F|nr:alpha/beta fold hydrolase [uncultured Nevskia sp.]